jgi:hypothetical protein
MKPYGGVGIEIFSTSALSGDDCPASRPDRFSPGSHWIGGCVDPIAGLDEVETILDPTGTRIPTPWPSSLYPVAIPTTLSRLPCLIRYRETSGSYLALH